MWLTSNFYIYAILTSLIPWILFRFNSCRKKPFVLMKQIGKIKPWYKKPACIWRSRNVIVKIQCSFQSMLTCHPCVSTTEAVLLWLDSHPFAFSSQHFMLCPLRKWQHAVKKLDSWFKTSGLRAVYCLTKIVKSTSLNAFVDSAITLMHQRHIDKRMGVERVTSFQNVRDGQVKWSFTFLTPNGHFHGASLLKIIMQQKVAYISFYLFL